MVSALPLDHPDFRPSESRRSRWGSAWLGTAFLLASSTREEYIPRAGASALLWVWKTIPHTAQKLGWLCPATGCARVGPRCWEAVGRRPCLCRHPAPSPWRPDWHWFVACVPLRLDFSSEERSPRSSAPDSVHCSISELWVKELSVLGVFFFSVAKKWARSVRRLASVNWPLWWAVPF